MTQVNMNEPESLPQYSPPGDQTPARAPAAAPPSSTHRSLSPAWQQQLKRCADAVASPLSAISSAVGMHGFAPVPVEKEFAKAAEVLDILCTSRHETASGPTNTKIRQHETIPSCVVNSAVGVLILTTGRLGLRRFSGSTGTGVLLVRDAESNGWCAPVAVRSYGVGAGPFAMGFEVTDRVYVLSSRDAIERLANAGFLVGPEAQFAAGRLSRGGGVTFAGLLGGKNDTTSGINTDIPFECSRCGHRQEHQGRDFESPGQDGTGGSDQGIRESLRNPIQCYMRSSGLYVGLQAEATVLEERSADNANFYGRPVSALHGPADLGELEKSLGAEKRQAVRILLDAVSRAELQQKDHKAE